MTDKQLLKVSKLFAKEIIGNTGSRNKCFMVSSALQGYLSMCGIEVQIADYEIWHGVNIYEHTALSLSDGRILDLTADQFNQLGYDMPQAYLGMPPEHYKAVARHRI